MSESARSEVLSLEAAFAAAPCAVVVADRDGAIVYVNRAAEGLLAASESMLAGQSLSAVLNATPLEEACNDAAMTIKSVDGQSHFVRLTLAPWLTGEVRQGVIAYLFDETARHLAEEGRRASEASLLEFIGRSPEPAVIHSMGVVLQANDAVARALGYPGAQSLVGQSLLELTHPDDRAVVQARVAHMMRTHEPLPVREERFLRRDGGTFTAEVFALPVMLDARIVFLAWGRDLTERKRADAERQHLLAQQTALRMDAQRRAAEVEGILDNMLTGLVVCDAQGRLTLANTLGAQMLGCRSTLELVGMTLQQLIERLDLRRLEGGRLEVDDFALTRALAGETVAVQDTRVQPPGSGERFFRSSAGPIRDRSGEVVAAVQVFRDNTDVIEFNRLKDQFLRVVAHELKTPVAIMKGYTDLLSRNPEAARRIDAVAAIRRGAERIDRIVTDMASLSGLLEHDLQLDLAPLRLDELVEGVARRLEPGLKKHRFAIQAVPAVVLGDAMRLEHVAQHLMDNAIRYSPKGGLVTVTMGVLEGKARLSVTDQGVGIPEEKQRRIFQRFYRAHTDTPHDYGGLGIGLSLSKELVELHGGAMWFESREGAGSTFTLELPLADTDA